MPEEWIVEVQGKEYGPVDLDQLRDWKQEGRLIPENRVRPADSPDWIRAGELGELFEAPVPEQAPRPNFLKASTFAAILGESWRIYRKGFWQFLALTALVVIPTICARLTSAAVGSPETLDLRAALAGLFNLFVFVVGLAAWPIYIAGLQILTSELLHGRSCRAFEIISRALKTWPRVAALCIVVYGAFFLLTLFGFVILAIVAAGAAAPILILLGLGLLFLQIWMFGRVFAATLFWQQTAVLEETAGAEALRRSNAIARYRGNLPWFRRPLWRGAFLASIWCVFATVLTVGPDWAMLTEYFNSLMLTQDPQAVLQAMNAHSLKEGVRFVPLSLAVLQAILRPLLGIAFVVLYFDVNATRTTKPS